MKKDTPTNLGKEYPGNLNLLVIKMFFSTVCISKIEWFEF